MRTILKQTDFTGKWSPAKVSQWLTNFAQNKTSVCLQVSKNVLKGKGEGEEVKVDAMSYMSTLDGHVVLDCKWDEVVWSCGTDWDGKDG